MNFENNLEASGEPSGTAPKWERLGRIANAERDRRAGRAGMAVAAIGEPVEWPARVVVALARLPDYEGIEARRVLVAGLDTWAKDFDLGALDEPEAPAAELEPRPPEEQVAETELAAEDETEDALAEPIEAAELDLAFADAQTEVESMRDVNEVAAQILADEPVGLAELAGTAIEETPSARLVASDAWSEDRRERPRYLSGSSEFDVGVTEVAVADLGVERWDAPDGAEEIQSLSSARGLSGPLEGGLDAAESMARPANAHTLATLERWLVNLESRRPRRTA